MKMRLLLLLVAMVTMPSWPVSASVHRCPTHLPLTSAWRVFRDTCYQFVYEERYWTSARDFCLHYGGRLVKIDDSATNQFVVTSLNGLWWRNSGVWIGLHDTRSELHWQWTGTTRYSNEHATWFNWEPGHPGAFLHRFRDCVRMKRGSGHWRWHETPCAALRWKYRFICQYEMAPTTTTSSTSSQPTPTSTLSVLGVIPDRLGSDQQPDADDRRGYRASTVPSTLPSTMSSSSVPLADSDTDNKAFSKYLMGSDQREAKHHETISTKWVIASVCIAGSCIILLIIVLLWRRRADHKLRVVAVATEEFAEDETEKDPKTISSPSVSEKLSGLLSSKARGRGKSNHYGPEPCPLKKIEVMREDRTKNTEPTGAYCPMNGAESSESDYLQPRADLLESSYLPMGAPPNYSSCAVPHPHDISYANTEIEGSNIDTTLERDCGMMGYDVPPPMNVYSEIPEDFDSDVVDAEGNHIYETVDQAKPE